MNETFIVHLYHNTDASSTSMFLSNRFNPLIKGSYILETSGNVFNNEHFYLNKLSFKKIIIDTCSMWSCSIFSSTSASCESARDNVACSSALPVKHQVITLTKKF